MLTVRKKYVDINGNVSKDKLQSMFRYFVYGEIIVSFPDFTRHFSSSLAETVDSVETAVLNQ